MAPFVCFNLIIFLNHPVHFSGASRPAPVVDGDCVISAQVGKDFSPGLSFVFKTKQPFSRNLEILDGSFIISDSPGSICVLELHDGNGGCHPAPGHLKMSTAFKK